jgi:hypothetical protein
MRLTDKALSLINNKTTKAKLCLALNFSDRWITKCIEGNKDNGPLTTVAALRVIKKETGLKESEILEETVTQSLAA